MTHRIPGLAALTLSIAALAVSWINRRDRIAYAETSVLMAEFAETAKAKKRFVESQKEWDKNLALLNDSLMAAMERMKAGYETASPTARKGMRETLQKRNDDLQGYSSAVKRMSEKREREVMEPVIKKLNSFLDQWGREHGYDLVLGTLAGGNILQADPRLNVTTQVLKDLNAHYADLPEKAAPARAKDADKKLSAATFPRSTP